MSANMLEAPDLAADPTVMALRPHLGSKALIIKTVEDYECAAEVLMQANTSIDTIEAARTKITVPMNAALAAVNEQARNAKAPYIAERTTIKTAMIAYDDIQEEMRIEEQRKANAVAQAEQDRLTAIATAATEKAEAAAKLLRDQAEEAQAKGHIKDAEKLLGRASSIQQKAEAKADEFNERASMVVAVVSDRQAPTVTGIAIPKTWSYEVIDESLIPRDYMDVGHVRIGKVVKALKGLCKIPGIRVFQVKGISAGRR
jgi:hypothetical protein